MRTILKNRKAAFLNISINYGGEKVAFNMIQALKIDEDSLNDEIKNQPSQYGFLLLLSKKLNTQFETLKQDRKRLYGKLFNIAKNKRGEQGRVYNDEMAKAWVESHKKFVRITQMAIQAKDDADTLFACVRAFEQRGNLIQTLSSNIRKEQ